MLALPSLNAPRSMRSASADPLAARLALALAGEGRIAMPRTKTYTVEAHVLQRRLKAWLEAQLAQFRIFKPGVHLVLGSTPYHADMVDNRTLAEVFGRNAYTVYVGTNQSYILGEVFYLEKRWGELEQRATGLAGAALSALDHASRHALPVYTPSNAEWHASYAWWQGEDNEEEIVAQYRVEAGENAPIPSDFNTRADFDKALPPAVCRPEGIAEEKLRKLARRPDVGEIARLTLELRSACKAAHRLRKDPEMHSSDEHGMQAIGYAAAVRWNEKDPMPELFDCYAHDCGNGEGYEEAYGWYASRDPAFLPEILRSLERRFEIARLIERLMPLIATKGHP